MLLTVCSAPSQAATWTVSAGTSVDQHDWTPAAALDVWGKPYELGSGRLQWRPVAALTAIAGHEATWRPGSDRNVWIGSGGAAFSLRDSGWFLALQAGAVDRITPGLSSHFQFVSSLGWHGSRLQLQLRHISNGRIGGGPNLGESMLLVGVRL
ncbi:hypothetical protein [Pseudoxanthomonas sp.]|uniref:hypothetical protein n=1 Tax=Pseudoxanthomonas sp. TaxID=1871049 RepID=UPI002610E833|nr:hypothetical protein [Pseudoxanthomonas sp.]WDS36584.1 MAG: hypothetical protein O8I58_01270 [Pseudoxanthomonas sp.]